MRQTNEAGLNLIKEFEGCVLSVYLDAAGLPTIGYGHLIKEGESFTTITQQEADALLQSDLSWAEQAVENGAKVPLTDNQFAACVSLTFNIGSGNFKTSTLLKKLNAGDYGKVIGQDESGKDLYDGAAGEFPKWCHAGGEIVEGLVRRRAAEQGLFLTA